MKGGENVRKISKERAMSLNGGFPWGPFIDWTCKIIPKIVKKFGK